uniref:Triple QxxK/R motif-containing protein n=3 Tax=Gallus gallus TaxID=9031 RepID=A0A8V0Y7M9_CHICK
MGRVQAMGAPSPSHLQSQLRRGGPCIQPLAGRKPLPAGAGGSGRRGGDGSPAGTGHRPAAGGRRRRSSAARPQDLLFVAFMEGMKMQAYLVIFELKTMGRKDASTARTPVDQYRKQIGKQDYKKTRPMLRATRLKAEAKKTAIGVKEVALVLAAILVLLLAFYAFFYLNISNEVDLDLDPDEN